MVKRKKIESDDAGNEEDAHRPTVMQAYRMDAELLDRVRRVAKASRNTPRQVYEICVTAWLPTLEKFLRDQGLLPPEGPEPPSKPDIDK